MIKYRRVGGDGYVASIGEDCKPEVKGPLGKLKA
jgi:hypothetical protein